MMVMKLYCCITKTANNVLSKLSFFFVKRNQQHDLNCHKVGCGILVNFTVELAAFQFRE